jgi:hypothetical protein
VNEEALAQWGDVAPKTNMRCNMGITRARITPATKNLMYVISTNFHRSPFHSLGQMKDEGRDMQEHYSVQTQHNVTTQQHSDYDTALQY